MGTTSKSRSLTVRMPVKEYALIKNKAAAENWSDSAVLLHYFRIGLAAESDISNAETYNKIVDALNSQRKETNQSLALLAQLIREQPVAAQLEEPKKGFFERVFGKTKV